MQQFRLTPIYAAVLTVMLTGCGGGGGGGGGGVVPVTAAPPLVVPARAVNPAQVSIAAGATVLVGVTDTGARVTHDEFVGKIASTFNVTDLSTTVTDNNGHGSATASLIGGKFVGYSANASLLVVKIGDGGLLPSSDMMRGVEYAALNGAKVINTSFSGWEFFDKNIDLPRLNSVVTNDAVWVVSAGNSGLNLSTSALTMPEDVNVATLLTASGQPLGAQTLIVGALDATGTALRAGSNFAGENADVQARFLAAPGTGLDAAGNGSDSGYQSFTGTSAAAPVVSAAAAAVRSKWPFLTAAQTAGILLDKANRTHALYSQSTCGTSGVENCGFFTFGQGILDFQAALTPGGPLALPASELVAGPTFNLLTTGMSVSPAFGDAFNNLDALQSVAAFDRYGRDYLVDLRSHVTNQASAMTRMGGINRFVRMSTAESSRMTYAGEKAGMTGAVRYNEYGQPSSVLFSLAHGDAAIKAYRFEQGEANPASQPTGLEGLRLMSYNATSPMAQNYQAVNGFGGHYALGHNVSLAFDHWSGANHSAEFDDGKASRSEVAVRFAPTDWMRLSLGAASQIESNAAFGAKGTGSMSMGQSSTFVSQTVALDVIPMQGATMFARFENGRMNDLTGGSLFSRISGISASQFALGSTYGNDKFQAALVASMPLRVNSARAELNVPVGRTLDGNVVYDRQRVDLSPSGRERSFEFALAARAGDNGVVQLNLARTLNPGHDASAAAVNSAVVSYAMKF